MNEIMDMIRIFLESDLKDATDFSIRLEDALCDNYDKMVAENKDATDILNEELPEICAGYELGKDIDAFKEAVAREYERALIVLDGNIDYEGPHYCPVYGKTVDADLCYESLVALKKMVKVSSVPELNEVKDIDAARKQCKVCLYSKL